MNGATFVGALVGVGIAILLIRLTAIDRRLNRLSRLDAKVDALLKASGIKFDEFQDVPGDVREALERGDTILAIKRFRQATGVGLKEAKDFVDEVRRRGVSAAER
jgi:ribosomal protein L7/L12